MIKTTGKVGSGLLALACLLGALGAMVFTAPAQAKSSRARVEHVIVLGSAGLRWSDIDPHKTPALWRLANSGSIGALSVRAANSITCPDAGWVTLAAGNRARGLSRGACGDQFPVAEPMVSGDNYQLVEQSDIVDRNSNLNHGAKPGALASSVRCTTAIGRSAAVAAAHPDGQVDNYYPSLPVDPAAALNSCPLTIVDVGDVSDNNRAQDVAALDANVASIERSRPASSTLLTIGLADFTSPPHLHVAIANGPDFPKRWLSSASTQREPFVQLIDVAPTVLRQLGVGVPDSVVGQPLRADSARSGNLSSDVDRLQDDDRAAVAQRPLVQSLFASIVLLNLALMAVATIFFRLRHRWFLDSAPEPGRSRNPQHQPWLQGRAHRYAHILQVAAVTLATLPVASFVADAVPWWRVSFAGALEFILIVAVMALVAVGAYLGPWRRNPLGAPAFVAAVTALVMAADVLSGSHLQLDSLAGYSPLVAGRFTGFGNIASAVFAGALLMAAGFVAQSISPRSRRITLLIVVSVVSVVIVGAPMWGDDFGGVIALTPALLLLVLRAAGVWLSTSRVLACVVAGFVAVSAFVLYDYSRPESERSHVGRFADQVANGTATTIIHRKAEANFSLLISSQLTFLVIAVAIFVPLVLLRRSAGLRRVFGLYPCARAGAIGILVAAVLGFALNDSGIAIPAFMSAVVVPLLIATSLRVLEDPPPPPFVSPPRELPEQTAESESVGSVKSADSVADVDALDESPRLSR